MTMGLCAVGRPSNTGGVSTLVKLLANHSDRPVVVLGENDRKHDRIGTVAQCPSDCEGCSWCWPGLYGARVTAERLSQALGRAVHHRQVVDAKDSRAWLLAHGADGAAFLDSLRGRKAVPA